MLGCLLIIANVCFSSAEAVSLHDYGLTSVAVVRAAQYTATLELRTDNILTPDWTRMAVACGENTCVAYFKHCAAASPSRTCDYYFSEPGDAQNTHLAVSFANRQSQSEAEASLSVVVGKGWRSAKIPLTSLKLESADTSPPVCPHRDPTAPC